MNEWKNEKQRRNNKTENRRVVQSGKALSNLFLTLNYDSSTLQDFFETEESTPQSEVLVLLEQLY